MRLTETDFVSLNVADMEKNKIEYVHILNLTTINVHICIGTFKREADGEAET